MTRERRKELEEEVRKSARGLRIFATVVAAILAIALGVARVLNELSTPPFVVGEMFVLLAYIFVLSMVQDVPE